jgi:hypothetical protein
MRRILLAVLALVAITALTAPTAIAIQWHRLRTVITETGGRPYFHGTVHLRTHAHHRAQRPCRSHRVVRLWRINPSAHNAELVGQTLTNRRGQWAITAHPNSGTYVAKTTRKYVQRNHVLCRSAHTRFVHAGH